jgi:hypothetical protein
MIAKQLKAEETAGGSNTAKGKLPTRLKLS